MKTKEHAFYYSYIAILCLCVLYRIATLTVLKTSFAFWNRFIVAATVSTCFFCISDVAAIKKEISTYEDVRFSFLFERSASLTRRLQKLLSDELERAGEKTDKEKEMMNRFDMAMNPEKVFIGTEKEGTLSFIFNTCGFFVFLLILVFETVYKLLLPIQDILTMVAFIIILCGTAYKEHKINQINTEIMQNIESQKRLMVATSVIEVYQEGKKKNNG